MKKFLKALDRILFPQIYSGFDSLEDTLKKEILPDCKTVLDIGCGITLSSPLKNIAPKLDKIVGIDLFEESIKINKKDPIYNEYFVWDAMKIDEKFEEKSFDCVVATDLIEHLTHEQGKIFLEKVEKIAKKKIIMFTPNGFIKQDEYEENKYQVHHSGWTVRDFKRHGFQKIYGINGLKILRGELAKMRFNPEFFWFRISLMTNLFTTKLPRLAFQILAIRKLS